MEDSCRGGGDFELYSRMKRMLNPMLGATHATTYLRLNKYERELWLKESALCAEAYSKWVWIQTLKSGGTAPADLWVELQIMEVRFRFGIRASRGLEERLLLFVRTLEDAKRLRGSTRSKSTSDTPREKGVVTVTQVLRMALETYRKSNLAGHGGIDSPIHVINPKKSGKKWDQTVPANTMVAMSGQPMFSGALEWPLIGRKRLEQYYDSEYFDGAAIKAGHFKIVPVTAEGAGQHLHFLKIRKETPYAVDIETLVCTCTKACKVKLFDKMLLTAELQSIRSHSGVLLGTQADVNSAAAEAKKMRRKRLQPQESTG